MERLSSTFQRLANASQSVNKPNSAAASHSGGRPPPTTLLQKAHSRLYYCRGINLGTRNERERERERDSSLLDPRLLCFSLQDRPVFARRVALAFPINFKVQRGWCVGGLYSAIFPSTTIFQTFVFLILFPRNKFRRRIFGVFRDIRVNFNSIVGEGLFVKNAFEGMK
ncbi:hypothetical protein TNCV_361201 [Trichonephila clavipes]|nr:hypothetical protein TNCV_361201 [Trichonephila clavipes]